MPIGNSDFFNVNRNIDVVMCVDATGGMHAMMDELRSRMSTFYTDMLEAFDEREVPVGKIRLRFVIFRDYRTDLEPMTESRFFDLTSPEEHADMLAFVDGGFDARGGGDQPENSLEALAVAMRSDFVHERFCRNVIILVTDAPPHPLGFSADMPSYPEDMPKNLDELRAMWEAIPRREKRMFLFAPLSDGTWSSMCEWENVFACDVRPAGSCCEIEMKELVSLISFGC